MNFFLNSYNMKTIAVTAFAVVFALCVTNAPSAFAETNDLYADIYLPSSIVDNSNDWHYYNGVDFAKKFAAYIVTVDEPYAVSQQMALDIADIRDELKSVYDATTVYHANGTQTYENFSSQLEYGAMANNIVYPQQLVLKMDNGMSFEAAVENLPKGATWHTPRTIPTDQTVIISHLVWSESVTTPVLSMTITPDSVSVGDTLSVVIEVDPIIPNQGLQLITTDGSDSVVDSKNLYPTGGKFVTKIYPHSSWVNGIFTINATYYGGNTSETFQLVTESEPTIPHGEFTLPMGGQENGDGVSAGNHQAFYDEGTANAVIDFTYHQGNYPLKNYKAIGFFTMADGSKGTDIYAVENLVEPKEVFVLDFENTVQGNVTKFTYQLLGGTLVLPTPDPEPEPQQSIEVSTTVQSYKTGDYIGVEGKVRDLYSGTPVSLILKAPNGNLVSIQQVTVSAEKKFSAIYDTNKMKTLMSNDGTYTITAQYGTPNRQATTSFEFDAIATPTPTPAKNTIAPASGSGAPGCEDTRNGCYLPNKLHVKVGQQVTFHNTDSAAHTWTSGKSTDPESIGKLFDTSLVMSGGSSTWTPKDNGTVPYFCMVHPWMSGVIVVGNGHNPEPTPEPHKTTVCHNGKEISIADNAVRKHVKHGDAVGQCPDTTPTPEPSPSFGKWRELYYEQVSKFTEAANKIGGLESENQALDSQINSLENQVDALEQKLTQSENQNYQQNAENKKLKNKVSNLDAIVKEQLKVLIQWVLSK